MTPPMTPREKVERALYSMDNWRRASPEYLIDNILTALASGPGDHAELARLAEAATPGPWQNGYDDMEGVVSLGSTDDGNVVCFSPDHRMELSFSKWPDNAAFIASANPVTVLALLAEIAALRERLETARIARAAHNRQHGEAERKLAEAAGIMKEWKNAKHPSNLEKVRGLISTFLSKEAERG